jgi:hypothetical protein
VVVVGTISFCGMWVAIIYLAMGGRQ